MDITGLQEESKQLSTECREASKESARLFYEYLELDHDDPRRIILREEWVALDKKVIELLKRVLEIDSQIREHQLQYRRPNGWITKYISALLPPLPERMPRYEFDAKAMASVPKYRFAPLVAIVAAIGTMAALSQVAAWMFVSPLSLIMGTAGVSQAGQAQVMFAVMVAIVALVSTMVIANHRRLNRAVHETALGEEQWFRSGAEDWSFSQRAVSCVSFGFAHIINLIYPLPTLIVLSGVGGVLMAIYLRTYRRTGDKRLATLAAARFHAVYNIYAVSLISLVVLTVFGLLLFAL